MSQQYHAYNHTDTGHEVRMKEMCDPCDCDQGMMVVPKWTGLSISQSGDLGFLNTTVFTVDKEWCEHRNKRKKNPRRPHQLALLSDRDSPKQMNYKKKSPSFSILKSIQFA